MGPSRSSGFRLRAQTPAKQLKFESCSAHHIHRHLRQMGPSRSSGFRLRAQTPAKQLKFESCSAHQIHRHLRQMGPSRSSGFRLRAQTPANRLRFESCSAHHIFQGFTSNSKRASFHKSSTIHWIISVATPISRRNAPCPARVSSLRGVQALKQFGASLDHEKVTAESFSGKQVVCRAHPENAPANSAPAAAGANLVKLFERVSLLH